MLAGVAYDATVQDVTSHAPMSYQGGASGYFHMALIGGDTDAKGCVNNGDVSAPVAAQRQQRRTQLPELPAHTGKIGLRNLSLRNYYVNLLKKLGDYFFMSYLCGR